MTDVQTKTAKGEFRESMTQLMRPDQVSDAASEQRRLEGMLSAPAHIANAIQDRAGLRKQLAKIKKMVETQAPRAYDPLQIDLALARERELRDKFTQGMPTQAEMRKRPAGAVDKHRVWEMRNKPLVLEWKNIRRRLHASGALSSSLPDATDIANIEVYRPRGGSGEMDMTDALIPGKSYHQPYMPESVVLSDQDISTLREVDPEMANMVAVLEPEQRSQIKDMIRQYSTAVTKRSEVDTEGMPEMRAVGNDSKDQME